MLARSRDGSDIYYETTGDAETALVLVHGWLGNVRWWDGVRDAFAGTHRVVALDLAGHGRSSRTRPEWTALVYADDITAVVEAVAARHVVLVGHSMAGAYATLAAPAIADRLILVDTMKDLDAMPPVEQIDTMLAAYRADFPKAVREVLPRFLFAPGSPRAVVERLTAEFLTATGDEAARLLSPLYRIDLEAAARAVQVPVRGIATDLTPSGRSYFADFAEVTLPGLGHYPMLEAPEAFEAALRAQLG